jgi:hypothetical protein
MRYQLKSFYTIDSLPEHNLLRDNVLSKITESNVQSIQPENTSQVSISLDGLDWEKSRDFSREWVKILAPALVNHLQIIGNEYGFKDSLITDLWFQQYNAKNYHGWHHHGNTFTGVYYLEFPEGSPKTQLLCPMTHNVMEADVREGDILLFPSYLIHKAPKVNDQRKTIVSWNMAYGNFTKQMETKLSTL